MFRVLLLTASASASLASQAAASLSGALLWRGGRDGLGVHAGRHYREGEIVERCYSLVISESLVPADAGLLPLCLFHAGKQLLFPFGWGLLYNEGAPNLMWEHEQLEDGNGNMRHYVVLRASREVTAGEELLLPRARQSPRRRDLPGVALQKALQGAVPALAAAETDFEDVLRYPAALATRLSDVHGLGVYARKAFAEGEIVEIAPSILLMESELGRLLADYRYSAERLHAGLFRVVLGCGSIYNHASAPNLAYRRVRVGSCAPSQSLSICYVAERDISAGEELLISYGKTWWSSRGVFDANQKAQLLLPPPSARTAEDRFRTGNARLRR